MDILTQTETIRLDADLETGYYEALERGDYRKALHCVLAMITIPCMELCDTEDEKQLKQKMWQLQAKKMLGEI